MTQFVKALKTSEVGDGEMKTVSVAGKKILIAHIGGEFFAIGDTCTHLGCSLGEGTLNGSAVTCPCHGGKFDLASGRVISGPPEKPAASYPVKIDGDDLMVAV